MRMEHYWPGALSDGEVHVWHLIANDESQDILKYMDCLFAQEKDKSNRFKFEKDRLRYITRHVFLRKVLACYLNTGWDQIKFRENDYGKPFIDGPASSQSLQFSMSKSNNHVLVAIMQNRLVGCDIERHNDDLDYKAIIDNYFSAQEIKFILGNSKQRTNFFDYWTAKEAYIKARGEGLSFPLDQFTLHIDNNDNVSMRENLMKPGDVDKWRIRQLKIGAGFSAAITIEGEISSVRQVNVINRVDDMHQ